MITTYGNLSSDWENSTGKSGSQMFFGHMSWTIRLSQQKPSRAFSSPMASNSTRFDIVLSFLISYSVCIYLISRWRPWDQEPWHEESSSELCYISDVQRVSNWYSSVSDTLSELSFLFIHVWSLFLRQNKILDLYSLFRFIGIKDFEDRARYHRVIDKPITDGPLEDAEEAQRLLKAGSSCLLILLPSVLSIVLACPFEDYAASAQNWFGGR